MTTVYQIFEYLDHHWNDGNVVFNSTLIDINKRRFKKAKWKEYYRKISEDIPMNMPESRGNPVEITLSVDAAFTGDLITRQSHTGIIIFINNDPIYWYSKRQATVEASTFGSEFVSLWVSIEMNDCLQYKLQMMRIPINMPSNVLCDKQINYLWNYKGRTCTQENTYLRSLSQSLRVLC